MALGGIALGAVGCGGGEDGSGGEDMGLLSPRVNTSNRAKPGGTLAAVQSAELSNMDALAAPNPSTAMTMAGYVYGRLIKFKPGIVDPAKGEMEGDLAESWELSGDKLQVTMKLRRGVKLDPRPPTNSREMTSDDVLFSTEKIKALSTYRTDVFNELNPLAPVLSFTAPDAHTIVIKLNAPDSLIYSLLASGRVMSIQPREAEEKFDPRNTARGWGPWRVTELRPSLGVEYERNSDYYVKGVPYFQGIDSPFISEYATRLSQFRAKNIWTGAAVAGEDVLPLKRDFPELLLHQGEFSRSPYRHRFGIEDQNAPTRDERVRQGISMIIDRDLIIETLQNPKGFRDAGIPVTTRWHSSMPAGWDGAWLDPQGSAFGPNAKFYKYDLAEAKKLFSAAGYPNGFEMDLWWAENLYGSAYLRHAETLAGELTSGGVRISRKPVNGTVFTPTITRGKGMFTGMGIQASSAQGHPMEFIRGQYHSKGGFGQDQPPFTPEPDIDAVIDRMTQEFDEEKLLTMMQDLQRDLAKRVRILLEPGDSPGLSLTWPWVGNAGVYRGYDFFAGTGTESLPYLWYDESKRQA